MKSAERKTGSNADTVSFTREEAEAWKNPMFQRPLCVNKKLLDLVQRLKVIDGVIPGIITLGSVDGTTYLLDGQHRRHAFLLSECPIGYADVRVLTFADTAEMGAEFVRLNTQIVRMRPDDILRGMEDSVSVLREIRIGSRVLGYTTQRRKDDGGKISMSLFLRVWVGSSMETPATPNVNAAELPAQLAPDDTRQAIAFVNLCHVAWGRTDDTKTLWASLNLILCAWLYRRMVLGEQYSSTSRWTRVTAAEFRELLMALGADRTYSAWLVGRHLSDRNRPPAYARVRGIITARLQQLRGGTKILLPQPIWDSAIPGKRRILRKSNKLKLVAAEK